MLIKIILTLITILGVINYWIRRRYKYWERRNIPYLKPSSLIFGNDADFMFKRKSMAEMVQSNYDAMAPYKFCGTFSFQNPILYLRDPELVKNILTRDFHHFYDRGFYFANKKEPLTRHMFNLTGNEWKSLRTKLSPTFTSGKMKMMFGLIKECVDDMKLVIDAKILENETLELKELLARYAIDVISSCAFGLKTNSLHDPNSEFRRMGVKTFETNAKLILRGLLFAFNPRFTNFLGIKSISDDINNFFINLVKNTVSYREKNGVVRNDFLNLLMSVQNEEKKRRGDQKVTDPTKNVDIELNVELMAAQCFLFFIAGFETSSNALSFTILELSKNIVLQKRLQEEIDNILMKYDENITYDSLQDLVYMDQVIAETMRMYPATPVLMRTCTIDYRVPDTDVVIEKGTVIFIPIYGFHHDPHYFPEPEIFDPERFSDKGKASRPHYCYLPFGEGPKICIGMRFGLMEIKLALTVLLKHYNFSISSNMKLPVKIQKHSPLLSCEGGIWVNCVKRPIPTPEL